jgi:hypothetical protein
LRVKFGGFTGGSIVKNTVLTVPTGITGIISGII